MRFETLVSTVLVNFSYLPETFISAGFKICIIKNAFDKIHILFHKTGNQFKYRQYCKEETK